MRALITGINGQDGSYLAEHLIAKGFEVHGVVRRHSIAENQDQRLQSLPDGAYSLLHLHYGDLLDVPSLTKIVNDVQPTHIFNLGAMSHVRISFDMPSFTIQTNGLSVLHLLEIIRTANWEGSSMCRLYQASSSEMFGNNVDNDGYQRLSTPMAPVSPYGCGKLLAYNLIRHYRHAYGLFCSNGILFNHESYRRGSNFVTNKVVKTAVQIYYGLKKELVLGNMDTSRDWGHSKDYTRAMIDILLHSEADDFIVATGETRTVRDMCKLVFTNLGLDMDKHIKQDPRFMRPEELKYLKGDSSRTREILRWAPEYTFEHMMDEMVEYWLMRLKP